MMLIDIQLFGGRGASSASSGGASGGTISATGTINPAPPQSSMPPPPNNNQNTVVTSSGTDPKSQTELANMTDDEYADYLTNSASADMPAFLLGSDSQRLIYTAGLNAAPDVVDDATFNKLASQNGSVVMYRTVNEYKDTTNGTYMSAKDIQEQTMYGDLTRIGGGRMGDGFYFADSKSSSLSYGRYAGDVKKTAYVKAIVNKSKMRVITENKLHSLYYNELNSGSKLGKALGKAAKNNPWGNSMTEYALHLGYNVVKSTAGDGYFNIIDRSVLTMSDKISAM